MAGRRQPTDLVVARGRKHLTKAEIDDRKSHEIPTPKLTRRITAPKWLPKELRPEFSSYCKQLVQLNIFCDLDKDTLGRYLVAQAMYQLASGQADACLRDGDARGAGEWSAIQDRYFKQAEKSAAALGLNISSRCSLVVPQIEAEDNDDPFLELLTFPPTEAAK